MIVTGRQIPRSTMRQRPSSAAPRRRTRRSAHPRPTPRADGGLAQGGAGTLRRHTAVHRGSRGQAPAEGRRFERLHPGSRHVVRSSGGAAAFEHQLAAGGRDRRPDRQPLRPGPAVHGVRRAIRRDRRSARRAHRSQGAAPWAPTAGRFTTNCCAKSPPNCPRRASPPPAQPHRRHARRRSRTREPRLGPGGSSLERADRFNDAAQAFRRASVEARQRGALVEARNHLKRAWTTSTCCRWAASATTGRSMSDSNSGSSPQR